MNWMEAYVVRCHALVNSLVGIVPQADIDMANHFISHGEPPEGMRDLAWSIVRSGKRVPASVIQQIREFAGDHIDEAGFPPNLDEYGSTSS